MINNNIARYTYSGGCFCVLTLVSDSEQHHTPAASALVMSIDYRK